MKITKSQLKQIIKEELDNVLNEAQFVSVKDIRRQEKAARGRKDYIEKFGILETKHVEKTIHEFDISLIQQRKPRLTHLQKNKLREYAKKISKNVNFEKMIQHELNDIYKIGTVEAWTDRLAKRKGG